MLKLIDLRGRSGDIRAVLPRIEADSAAARESVRGIIADVRARGDAAVLDAEARFGNVRDSVVVSEADIEAALSSCPAGVLEAIRGAASRIRDYHARQVREERSSAWQSADGWVGEQTRPLGRVGCYVPGGRAAYPSTVLMTAIPAQCAGVGEICVCVPAGESGVHPATLAALGIVGVREVYATGGAQAVAAMAYGTQTVRRVDKIVGPGSIWVTIAKHEVAMDVGVDSFAGPTEVGIVADDSTPALFVAADLIAQAEHDPLATPVLITPSERLALEVCDLLEKEVPLASRSGDIAAALKGQGRAIVVDDLAAAVAAADAFAPEHLELAFEGAEEWLPKVRNAGAIFVGVWSPVAIGDYAAGTNHVLPTAGTARFASPLRASDFLKSTAVIRFDREGLRTVAGWGRAMATEEGLEGHARAIEVRFS